jgi:hypothetical protein
MYFEKQEKLLCSLHALNNLFGTKIATFNALKKTANIYIKRLYYSTHRTRNKHTYKEYYSIIRPKLYDCRYGYFSPHIIKLYVNSFTDFILKDVKKDLKNTIDIIEYLETNPLSLGLILNVTKYDIKHHDKYNHSISIKACRSARKLESIILFDSELNTIIAVELKHKSQLKYITNLFQGSSKIYTINNVQSLFLKSITQINKQVQFLHNYHDGAILLNEDIKHTVMLSPTLLKHLTSSR